MIFGNKLKAKQVQDPTLFHFTVRPLADLHNLASRFVLGLRSRDHLLYNRVAIVLSFNAHRVCKSISSGASQTASRILSPHGLRFRRRMRDSVVIGYSSEEGKLMMQTLENV
jgi:hypothetical protein